MAHGLARCYPTNGILRWKWSLSAYKGWSGVNGSQFDSFSDDPCWTCLHYLGIDELEAKKH